MIKEIGNFIESLPPEFKGMGIKPKEGLHIMLQMQEANGTIFMDEHSIIKVCYTKNATEFDAPFLKQCAALTQVAWSVNTNKCFDLPAKGIHSCSPYCIAFKRESLEGGDKFDKDKVKIYERIDSYFENAFMLIEEVGLKERLTVFKNFINSKGNLELLWSKVGDVFKEVKDKEYIVLYLDEPIEAYQRFNEKYLADKLFNTKEHNVEVGMELYGTSDFFNGFPTGKPYLTHQSASFDIAGRITEREARALYEFKDIIGRNILPRPLPIFIFNEELKKKSITLFKREAEEGRRIGYKEIIESLQEVVNDDIGNYYLLYYMGGEIKDFDFVTKFDYQLVDAQGKPWQIDDLFGAGNSHTLRNVFDLHMAVMLPIFNNSLIVRTKKGDIQYKYFDDIDAAYCKSANTYLQVLKYRKAFYDFIYKSKRQSITKVMFDDILLTGILDDMRVDEYKQNHHKERANILQKLNIWFSLSDNFIHSNNSNESMASKLKEHREFMVALAKGEAAIQTDDQYAFAVGQVIYYLFSKSKTADRSYKRLEPFLQQVQAKELNKAIARLFDMYKHETFSSNFRNPFAEIMDYDTDANIRNLMPTMMAGIFSKNLLFSDKEITEVVEMISETEE